MKKIQNIYKIVETKADFFCVNCFIVNNFLKQKRHFVKKQAEIFQINDYWEKVQTRYTYTEEMR